ncbi:hypothetical protein [Neobacillus sp. D3-1R]|uniref:hypothetical protein n=1 Tax=Neobacillus sp. D3-1R TaxID=3445778 RepID=UPI003FA00BB2
MELKINIFKYEPYLSEINFYNLQHCVVSFREKQYLSSAVWGAVFLEGFLVDLVKELDVKKHDFKDLNEYITALYKYDKIANNPELTVPDEIAKRCDEIRQKRNRLVHATGHGKETLQLDAQSIVEYLRVILDWYITKFPPKTVNNQNDQEPTNEEGHIPVFISTINPDTEYHKFFLELFMYHLKKMGIKPIRADLDDYDKNDPIGKIRQFVAETEAMIVIGLERSHAYFLRDRVGGSKEEDKIHTKYTSGWLHLEAGIANALQKDIFVIAQNDICSDGVFDRSWNTYPVIEIDFGNRDIDAITSMFEETGQLAVFFKKLNNWVTRTKESLNA